MNQTLKQNVVFTGSVETTSGVTPNTQSALGGIGGGGGSPSGAMQDNLQAVTNQHQWQWSNSRNRRLAARGK
jgi:hypothetical protein